MARPHLTRSNGLWTCMGAGLLANGHTPWRAWSHWKLAFVARELQLRAMRRALLNAPVAAC